MSTTVKATDIKIKPVFSKEWEEWPKYITHMEFIPSEEDVALGKKHWLEMMNPPVKKPLELVAGTKRRLDGSLTCFYCHGIVTGYEINKVHYPSGLTVNEILPCHHYYMLPLDPKFFLKDEWALAA